MPRKTLIKSDIYPYHVTARVNNKEHFPADLSEVWKVFSTQCLFIQTNFEVEIHAAVVMPNHFHLLLTTPNPDFDLGVVMQYFMSNLTCAITSASARTGRVFGSRYHWTLVKSGRYYGHVLKYLYRNPVRAKLCSKVEQYEFSTLHGLCGFAHLPFPIHFPRCGADVHLPNSHYRFEWLNWLNIPFSKEAEDLIRKCLIKKEVDFLMSRKTRSPEPLLAQLL